MKIVISCEGVNLVLEYDMHSLGYVRSRVRFLLTPFVRYTGIVHTHVAFPGGFGSGLACRVGF